MSNSEEINNQNFTLNNSMKAIDIKETIIEEENESILNQESIDRKNEQQQKQNQKKGNKQYRADYEKSSPILKQSQLLDKDYQIKQLKEKVSKLSQALDLQLKQNDQL